MIGATALAGRGGWGVKVGVVVRLNLVKEENDQCGCKAMIGGKSVILWQAVSCRSGNNKGTSTMTVLKSFVEDASKW